MIPGLVSKLSEAAVSLTNTLDHKSDIIRVTSTTSTTVLATLRVLDGGFGSVCFLVNLSGANMTTVTTGNINTARTIPDQMVVPLVYSKVTGKWYVGAIS